jgi:F0F1-type ATP synthase delta subunit
MICQPSLLARKYARAYLAVFGKKFSEQELSKLEELKKFLHENRALSLYAIATESTTTLQHFFDLLTSTFGLPKSIERLCALLERDRRLFMLKEVIGAISYEYKRQQGIVVWDITSSQHLSPEQLVVIKKYLAQKTGTSIEVEVSVDPALIAGLRFQSEALLWEDSLRKQLAAVMLLKDNEWT